MHGLPKIVAFQRVMKVTRIKMEFPTARKNQRFMNR